jgi:hypothetical protein
MCLNETYSKIRIGKYLSDNFAIQNGLSPLLFNFALEYAIRKVQENQVGQKLNETRQLLVSADDVNLMWHRIKTLFYIRYVCLGYKSRPGRWLSWRV